MTVALCWLAIGVWLSGRPRKPSRRSRRSLELSPRVMQGCAVASVAVTATVLAGPLRGAAIAGALAPLVISLMARLSMRGRRSASERHRAGLPLTLDLAATVLRSGQPVPAAVLVAAPAAGPIAAAQLSQVAGLLRLGADPEQAWRAFLDDPVLAPVARTACRSADSGIRLANGLERLAVELRADARGAAQAKAQRAGVWAVAPLGLCFLPAFVCIGIVPVVAGVAQGVFTGLGP